MTSHFSKKGFYSLSCLVVYIQEKKLDNAGSSRRQRVSIVSKCKDRDCPLAAESKDGGSNVDLFNALLPENAKLKVGTDNKKILVGNVKDFQGKLNEKAANSDVGAKKYGHATNIINKLFPEEEDPISKVVGISNATSTTDRNGELLA
jgi:hypothetical protein